MKLRDLPIEILQVPLRNYLVTYDEMPELSIDSTLLPPATGTGAAAELRSRKSAPDGGLTDNAYTGFSLTFQHACVVVSAGIVRMSGTHTC